LLPSDSLLKAQNFTTPSNGESMRYLIIMAIAYFVFKTLKRLITDLKIRVANSNDVKGGEAETPHRLQVDEADIEDAEFKDVE